MCLYVKITDTPSLSQEKTTLYWLYNVIDRRISRHQYYLCCI